MGIANAAKISFTQQHLTYNLMIGPRTAEDIKISIGSAYPLVDNELEMEVRGRDQVAGLPVTKRINSVEIRECLAEPIQQITEGVKLTLEKCPPELASDLVERGMVLAGGGALSSKGSISCSLKKRAYQSKWQSIRSSPSALELASHSNLSINSRSDVQVKKF